MSTEQKYGERISGQLCKEQAQSLGDALRLPLSMGASARYNILITFGSKSLPLLPPVGGKVDNVRWLSEYQIREYIQGKADKVAILCGNG